MMRFTEIDRTEIDRTEIDRTEIDGGLRPRTGMSAECPTGHILLWFAFRRTTWKSLAFIPANPGDSSAPYAKALVDGSAASGGEHLELLDARRLSPVLVSAKLRELGRPPHPVRTVVVLPSVLEEPAHLALAVQVDACILTITLERAELAKARRTIERVGRSRWMGSVTGRVAARGRPLSTSDGELVFFGRSST